RHDFIGDEYIEAGQRRQHGDRLVAAYRHRHFVASILQHAAHEQPHRFLIVDDQHPKDHLKCKGVAERATAARSVPTSRGGEHGFVSKAAAPAISAAVWMPWSSAPVRMMTGMSAVRGSRFRRRQTSSPSISGMRKSSTIASGIFAMARTRASRPRPAVTISKS